MAELPYLTPPLGLGKQRAATWPDAADLAGGSVSFAKPRFCLGTLGARAFSRGAALGARASSRGAALDACAPACGARQRGGDDSQSLLESSGRSRSLPKRSGRIREGVSFPPHHARELSAAFVRPTHTHTRIPLQRNLIIHAATSPLRLSVLRFRRPVLALQRMEEARERSKQVLFAETERGACLHSSSAVWWWASVSFPPWATRRRSKSVNSQIPLVKCLPLKAASERRPSVPAD